MNRKEWSRRFTERNNNKNSLFTHDFVSSNGFAYEVVLTLKAKYVLKYLQLKQFHNF